MTLHQFSWIFNPHCLGSCQGELFRLRLMPRFHIFSIGMTTCVISESGHENALDPNCKHFSVRLKLLFSGSKNDHSIFNGEGPHANQSSEQLKSKKYRGWF